MRVFQEEMDHSPIESRDKEAKGRSSVLSRRYLLAAMYFSLVVCLASVEVALMGSLGDWILGAVGAAVIVLGMIGPLLVDRYQPWANDIRRRELVKLGIILLVLAIVAVASLSFDPTWGLTLAIVVAVGLVARLLIEGYYGLETRERIFRWVRVACYVLLAIIVVVSIVIIFR